MLSYRDVRQSQQLTRGGVRGVGAHAVSGGGDWRLRFLKVSGRRGRGRGRRLGGFFIRTLSVVDTPNDAPGDIITLLPKNLFPLEVNNLRDSRLVRWTRKRSGCRDVYIRYWKGVRRSVTSGKLTQYRVNLTQPCQLHTARREELPVYPGLEISYSSVLRKQARVSYAQSVGLSC